MHGRGAAVVLVIGDGRPQNAADNQTAKDIPAVGQGRRPGIDPDPERHKPGNETTTFHDFLQCGAETRPKAAHSLGPDQT